jgi:lipoyl-dependent peroxiredoxin
MEIKRKASAVWHGSGKDGKGMLTTQSFVLDETQYSYNTRFEDGKGTNPEELVAAAHAGCFCMKLSFVLQAAGFTAESLEAECTIVLAGGVLAQSNIALNANVPGIDGAKFDECVKDAEANCPISKSLNSQISVTYNLISE